MPKARLSRSTIDKLEAAPGKQISYFDTRLTGFGVKVNTSGTRSYFVQCRVKDRKNAAGNPLEIYVSLGRTDVVDFEKAYNKAKTVLENAALGITPDDIRAQNANLEADKKAAAIAEEAKNVTFGEAFEKYKENRKRLKESTIDTYKKDMDRYIPDWVKVPIRTITGNMVLEKHAEIGKKSKARADGTMRLVRAVFNHAVHVYEGIIDKNPVDKLSAIEGWYNVPRRETYLKPADLAKWLTAVLNLHYDTSQDFILLMLFNGSRKTETGMLKWKDINLTTGTAIFRETKTGVVLEVPLSQFIIKRLEARMQYYYAGPDSYVFPSYGECGHITEVRSALQTIKDATGIRVSHHDLRRSFISYCEELEITMFGRKRLVNHAIPLDVTEGYTQFSMEKLREIIERVASFILAHAGIPYNGNETPLLTPDQAARVAGTPFWESLTAEQREAFQTLLKKEPPPGKVINLEAEKVRRRMKVKKAV